jgi:hypothetical protein
LSSNPNTVLPEIKNIGNNLQEGKDEAGIKLKLGTYTRRLSK